MTSTTLQNISLARPCVTKDGRPTLELERLLANLISSVGGEGSDSSEPLTVLAAPTGDPVAMVGSSGDISLGDPV